MEFLSILISASLVLAAAQPQYVLKANQQNATPGSVFDHVVPLLREKSRVPLRLPTYLATEDEEYPLYAIIETVTPSHYEIQLAFTKDCTGGNACRYGMVAGRTVRPTAKQERGKPVILARGITGYFVDAICGANCSDSTLSWKQDGYLYTVGIKAASIRTLIKVANSAIEDEDHQITRAANY